MSATERLFYGEADASEIINNFGVVPTPEVIRHVTGKLHKFGRLGIKGFDLAIATYSIMRGDSSHAIFLKNVDGQMEEYKKPFDFMTPSSDAKDCSSHGIEEAYKYGLNILSRTLRVDLLDYEANDDVRVIAKSLDTDNWLLSKRITELPDDDIDFGYDVFPSNVSSIAGYLVLPKQEAIEIVQESVLQQLV